MNHAMTPPMLQAVFAVQIASLLHSAVCIPRYSRQNHSYHAIPPTSFGIYHSLWDIFNVLKEIPEVMNLPPVYDLYERMIQNKIVQLPKGDRKPFIVIEGVKGSGKSALTVTFAQNMNATYLRAPPEYLTPFKMWMKTRNKLERNAFHALSNYLLAEQAKQMLESKLVVMDLYWHGLTAYELGRLSGRANVLPVPSSPIYKWPEDLLVPDIAFYLMVTEESRYYREKHTNAPAISRRLRDAMYKAFGRFHRPRMVHVNGDRSRREVEAEIRNITCRVLQGLLDN
ncbi:UMP kinase activity, variant 2 [Homalodisca vitripennis]|nr:UMP kinase activity, variant 2 [Homalodisca vitripennis]